MRALAAYILRGRTQAAGMASVLGLLGLYLPPLTLVSGATVALVTLRLGLWQGISVTLLATVICVLASSLALGSPLPIAGLLVMWLPSLLAAQVLSRTRSQGLMLSGLGLLALLAAGALRLFIDDVDAWWRYLLNNLLQQVLTGGEPQQIQDLVKVLAPQMNGIFVATLLLSLMLSLLLARWWQSLLLNPGGFALEFQRLALPQTLAMVTVLAVGYDSLVGGIGLLHDAVDLLAVMYMLQGLAVLHRLVALRRMPHGMLVAAYALVGLVAHYGVILMASIGIADAIIDLRGLRGPRDKGPDE